MFGREVSSDFSPCLYIHKIHKDKHFYEVTIPIFKLIFIFFIKLNKLKKTCKLKNHLLGFHSWSIHIQNNIYTPNSWYLSKFTTYTISNTGVFQCYIFHTYFNAHNIFLISFADGLSIRFNNNVDIYLKLSINFKSYSITFWIFSFVIYSFLFHFYPILQVNSFTFLYVQLNA